MSKLKALLATAALSAGVIAATATPAHASYADGNGCFVSYTSMYSTGLNAQATLRVSCTPNVLEVVRTGTLQVHPHWYSGWDTIGSTGAITTRNTSGSYWRTTAYPSGPLLPGCHDYRGTVTVNALSVTQNGPERHYFTGLTHGYTICK